MHLDIFTGNDHSLRFRVSAGLVIVLTQVDQARSKIALLVGVCVTVCVLAIPAPTIDQSASARCRLLQGVIRQLQGAQEQVAVQRIEIKDVNSVLSRKRTYSSFRFANSVADIFFCLRPPTRVSTQS